MPVQSTHAVRSAFGCWPGAHAVQVWWSALTTFGVAHSWHWPVMLYSTPVHSTHAVLFGLGPSPALHVMHPVAPSPSVFVTCPRGHGSHEGAPAPANVPTGHSVHSVSASARVLPAAHGTQKKRWSCASPPPGPIVPAGHNSHMDIEWRVSVVCGGHA